MKKYKRNIYFILSSFFIFLSPHAKTNKMMQTIITPPAHAKELTEIFERNVLRVAMYEIDTPPFYFLDKESELAGIDIEIINGFARELGVNTQFIRSQTLDEAVDMVAKGNADLAICKLSITFLRATKVLFTIPYIKLRKGLLVNRLLLQKQLNKRSKEETIQHLTGTLGVIANSSYVTFAKKRFKHMDIKEYPSWKAVVDDVLSNKIIAAFRDEAEVKKIILDNKNHAMKLLTVVLKEDFDPKGIALPYNANHLKALLDFYIDSLGLTLTANSVLFEYDSVVEHLNRYRNNENQ